MAGQIIQNGKPLRHFTKQLFLVSRAYSERNRAKNDIYLQLQRMRKSIIRMSLTYTDIDRLKRKMDTFMVLERKYAKYFRSGDDDRHQLQSQINFLREELENEKEEKLRIISEHEEKIREMAESLENIKSRMKHLLIEKAKRQHRLKSLESKINKNTDKEDYFK